MDGSERGVVPRRSPSRRSKDAESRPSPSSLASGEGPPPLRAPGSHAEPGAQHEPQALRRKPVGWEALGDATQRCFFLNFVVVVVCSALNVM